MMFEDVLKQTALAKTEGKRVVLATGVFDLLHQEHKNYLQRAKQAGEFLVVALESDVRARQLKGDGRPVHPQAKRLQNVEALPYVDCAFVLPDDFNSTQKYEQLIADLKPDIYACSSHSPYLENKRAMIEKYGGELVVVHEHNPAVSTTKLISVTNR